MCIAIMIGQKEKKCHHIGQRTLCKLQPIDPMVILSYLKTTLFPCAERFFSACKGGTSTGIDMLAQRAYEPGLTVHFFDISNNFGFIDILALNMCEICIFHICQ